MRAFRFFVTLILFSVFCTLTFGAEFFRKQSGTTTIAGGSNSVAVAITSVDMSRSFLVFSSTIDSNQPQYFQVGGELSNATTLTFARTGTTGTITISWQIFEFESGVYVQHGSTLNVTRGAPMNVAINCVDVAKSFVLVTARKSGSQMGADDGVTANLVSPTNMQLMISSAGPGGADMEEAYWQVIEYQASTVKKLTATLAAGSTTTTSTISPAITNLSKAIVVSNHWFDGDVNSDDLPMTELTNTTTVTYTRASTATNMNFVTYVIEFTDQSTVSRGTRNFGSGNTSLNEAITASASSGVIAPGNYGRQGSTDFSTDDNPGHNWFTYEITSSTNLRIQRAASGSSASAPWQIVTFEDTGLQQNTFYSRASGDWESNTSWSFTSDGSSGAVPSGVYPRRSDNVVIQNGHSITINSVTDNGPCSQSPDNLGRSNVGSFTGSGDQMFYHTGDILIAGGATLTSSEELMLEGYTLVDGTLTVNEDIINLGYMEITATSTFTNTDDLILSGNSTTIIDNVSVGFDDIYIDWTNATLCGSGVMNLGNGSPDPTVQFFNGGSLNQICSGFTITCSSNCGAFPITPTGNFSSGNTGPGGVGSTTGSTSLKAWYRVDNGISTTGTNVDSWTNSAGIAALDITETAGQRPTLVSGALNGFDEVSFSGSNRLRTGLTLTTSNFVNDKASSFTVTRADNTTQTSSVYMTDPIVGNRFSNHIPWAGGVYFDIGNCCGNDSRLDVAGLSGLTSYSIWSYDADPSSGKQLYRNGSLLITRALTSAFTGHASSRFNIGGNSGVNGYEGDITEVILFNAKVNTAQRIVIENYLSAKYNIPLAANDVYVMDDAGNGSYDFDLAGIGQASDGTNHRDARGTGSVRMWNPQDLNNNEFLIWGCDNTVITSTTLVDVDGTVIEERLSRIWRVSETGDVGPVSISFDFSGVGGSPLGSNLRLLIDRDGDGFADNDVTPIVGSVSNGIAVFSNVNFQNGDRFTLGNTDAAIPLPIALVFFKASPSNSSIRLQWKTEMELNNDFFTIERSMEGEVWKPIIQLKGAGTSTTPHSYQVEDEQPLSGVSYYRLKQTDFDGNATLSSIVAVSYNSIVNLRAYPNPSSGLFRLNTERNATTQVRVFTTVGQLIPVTTSKTGSGLTIDISPYPAGIYILRVSDGHVIHSIRLIKQ